MSRTSRRLPRRSRLLPLVVVAVLLAGCSGSSDDAGDDVGAGPSTTASPSSGGEESTSTTGADDPSSAPEGGIAGGDPVPSAGCGVPTTATDAVELERKELLGDRYYLLSTPPDATVDTPLPVVLDFHGLLEGAQVHSVNSGFGPYAAERGFIAVFPHGRGEPVKWEVGLDRATNPDLVYVDALLDQLETERCIDTSRVYATGLSYGAIMSSTIGCAMTDRFAAIAPVDGITMPEGCAPERAVPVLTFHGTVDPILLFNGGVANLGGILGDDTEEKVEPPPADLDGEGYPATAAAWAEQNGCTGDPIDTDRTESVVERTWDCPASSPVVFEIMVGAGHSWPGSDFSAQLTDIVGPTDMSIDGTELIWQFFQRFQLPAA